MIDWNLISRLKGAILVNTSRADVIDPEAVLKGLEKTKSRILWERIHSGQNRLIFHLSSPISFFQDQMCSSPHIVDGAHLQQRKMCVGKQLKRQYLEQWENAQAVC